MKRILARCALLGGLTLLFAAGDLAAESPVSSRRVVVQPQPTAGSTAARLDLEWMGGRPVEEAGQAQSFDVTLGAISEPLPLDVPDETVWQLELVGDGIYSPTILINLLGDDDPSQVVMPVYPTVPLTAALRLSDEALPSEASLRFQPVSSSGVPEAGEVDCTLDETHVTCPVPRASSAHLDLKLRVPGYASHFVWEREIPVSGLDLGQVELVVGGSLVGRVEAEDGRQLDDPVAVTLKPAGSTPSASDAERGRLLDETVRTDERGFFHFRGLAPGSYRVRAQAEGFAPLVTAPIPLTSVLEAELSEPLILRRPVELTVTIEPAVDSRGRPWNMSLLDLSTGHGELVDRGRSDRTGAWRTASLPSGGYHLVVVDSRGTRMALEEVELSHETRSHAIRLDSVEVAGEIRLGGEVLPRARVIFGGRSGKVSVELVADDSGQFAGTVPRAGTWNVEVIAHLPPVARRLAGIEVAPDGEGTAWLPIDLPDTAISGEVVDDRDEPVARVHVLLLTTAERPLQSITDERGEFAFHGLEPGRYRVEARQVTPESTSTVEGEWLEVEEGEDASTRLVLRPQRRLVGTVSFAGEPAAGVEIVPASEAVPMIASTIRSGVDGRFEIEIPEQLDAVTLTALLPGADLFTETYPVGSPGEDLSIRLVPASGTALWLDGLDPGATRTIVTHDGQRRFGIGLLRRWASINGSGQGEDGLRVPAMPAGLYEICGTSGSCSDGYLPPAGELHLELSAGVSDRSKTRGESL